MSKIKIITPYDNLEQVNLSDIEKNNGDNFNNVKTLQVGFGSKVFRIDREGMWAGAERFADAPWSVDWNGNMVATSLDLSGYLQVGQALTDVQADILDLSDISTDLGVITAGTLIGLEVRGGLIRTSTSGARVEIDGNTDTLEIYDVSGNKRIVLDEDELLFYNASEVEMGSVLAQSNYLSINTTTGASLGVVFMIDGTQKAAITSAGLNLNDNLIAATSGIDIGSSSQGFDNLYIQDIYFTAKSGTPTVDGQLFFYNSGGTQELRIQFGGFDFKLDAS